MIDFTRLADVAAVDEIQDGDTVLVVRDGEVYRADKGNIGGAGGYVLEIGVEDVTVLSSDDLVIAVTKPVDEMLEVVKKGGHVVMALDAAVLPMIYEEFAEQAEMLVGTIYEEIKVICGSFLDVLYAEVLGFELTDIALGSWEICGEYGNPSGGGIGIIFTNGQEILTEVTAAALSLGGGSGGSGGMAALKARLGVKAVDNTTAEASEATQEVKAVE